MACCKKPTMKRSEAEQQAELFFQDLYNFFSSRGLPPKPENLAELKEWTQQRFLEELSRSYIIED